MDSKRFKDIEKVLGVQVVQDLILDYLNMIYPDNTFRIIIDRQSKVIEYGLYEKVGNRQWIEISWFFIENGCDVDFKTDKPAIKKSELFKILEVKYRKHKIDNIL